MASFQPYRGPPSPEDYPYPPAEMQYNASNLTSFNSKASGEGRRTPSPTPSEEAELKSGVFSWKQLSNWRFWIRREWLWYYVALVVILVLVALMSIFHTQIVHWLTPFANWLHGLPAGWLVPIAILFVISFPPLFGHEIVAVLCGVVWGLWIGFGIVAAGTFLGEVGNFYAFKYCCRARGEKLERTKISYACLAKVVREGGFKIALIARLSAIPGHFTTAVFSTCGMGIITFSIAAILSMPKQLITVYLGVILEQSGTGVQNTRSRIISDVVLVITFLVTILAMWYIYHQMNRAKPAVIYDRRKARQAKIARGDFNPYPRQVADDSSLNVVFNPNVSDSNIPLTGNLHQKWDQSGRAVGYAGDPRLYAPQPKHAPLSPGRLPVHSTVERYSNDSGPTSEYDVGVGSRGNRQDSVDSIGWDMQTPGRAESQPRNQPSPSQGPGSIPYTHISETSGDSYYSAQSDGLSRTGTESPAALGQRAFSPPPASYRTDLR